MRFLAILLVSLVALPIPALAEGLDGGTPADVPPADAGAVNAPPPTPIMKGQPAPDDGWFFTNARAQQLSDDYDKCQQQGSVGMTSLLVAAGLGLLGGAVLVYTIKK